MGDRVKVGTRNPFAYFSLFLQTPISIPANDIRWAKPASGAIIGDWSDDTGPSALRGSPDQPVVRATRVDRPNPVLMRPSLKIFLQVPDRKFRRVDSPRNSSVPLRQVGQRGGGAGQEVVDLRGGFEAD